MANRKQTSRLREDKSSAITTAARVIAIVVVVDIIAVAIARVVRAGVSALF